MVVSGSVMPSSVDSKPAYQSYVHDRLSYESPALTAPLALDLFAGCGGLALGLEAAGLRTVGYEMESAAADTYRSNLHGECHVVKLGPDTEYEPGVSAVVGGPPCQPFSVGGLQQGPGWSHGRHDASASAGWQAKAFVCARGGSTAVIPGLVQICRIREQQGQTDRQCCPSVACVQSRVFSVECIGITIAYA